MFNDYIKLNTLRAGFTYAKVNCYNGMIFVVCGTQQDTVRFIDVLKYIFIYQKSCN